MRYEQPVYRPPSEGGSYILQATVGCSHNRCTFCSMYKMKKYRERDMAELLEDIDSAVRMYRRIRRVFLADGDALAMDKNKLLQILEALYAKVPGLERVSIYATPQNILHKEEADLEELNRAGLQMVYLGIESGSGEILKSIKKGATPEEMVAAGLKAKEAGFVLSATLILGLGGADGFREHALESARVVSKINPDYLGALTLMLHDNTPFHRKVERGEFKVLSPLGILEELEVLIENLETRGCIFRSNHASNYLTLKGTLREDREKLLALIRSAKKDPAYLRTESMRGF